MSEQVASELQMRGTYVVLQRTLARLELGLSKGEVGVRPRGTRCGIAFHFMHTLISLRSDSSAAAASSPASFALSGFFASIILQGRAADRVSFWASRGTRARLDAAAGAQLRAGLVPRRELGRRRGDGGTRQVTDW